MAAHRPRYPPSPPARAPSVKRTFDELGHDPEPSVNASPQASGSRAAARRAQGTGRQVDRHKRARSGSDSSQSDSDEIVFSPQGSSSSSISSPSGNASGTDIASSGGASSNIRNRNAAGPIPLISGVSPEVSASGTSATQEQFRVSMERYNAFDNEISVLRRALSPEHRSHTSQQASASAASDTFLRPANPAASSNVTRPTRSGHNSTTWSPWHTPVFERDHVREPPPTIFATRSLASPRNALPALLDANEDHIPASLDALLEPPSLPRIPDYRERQARSPHRHERNAPSRLLTAHNLEAFSESSHGSGLPPRYVSPVDEQIVFPNREWDSDSDDDYQMSDAEVEHLRSATSLFDAGRVSNVNVQAEHSGNVTGLRDLPGTQSTTSRGQIFASNSPGAALAALPHSSPQTDATDTRIHARLNALADLYRNTPSLRQHDYTGGMMSDDEEGGHESTAMTPSDYQVLDWALESNENTQWTSTPRPPPTFYDLSRPHISEQLLRSRETNNTPNLMGNRRPHEAPRSSTNAFNPALLLPPRNARTEINDLLHARPSSSQAVPGSSIAGRTSASRPRPTSAMFPSTSLASEAAAERRRLAGITPTTSYVAGSLDWLPWRPHDVPAQPQNADESLNRRPAMRPAFMSALPSSDARPSYDSDPAGWWCEYHGRQNPTHVVPSSLRTEERSARRRVFRGWLDPLDDSPARETSPGSSQSWRVLVEVVGPNPSGASRPLTHRHEERTTDSASRNAARTSDLATFDSQLEENRRTRQDRLAELRRQRTSRQREPSPHEDAMMELLSAPHPDPLDPSLYGEYRPTRSSSRQTLPSIRNYFDLSPQREPAARTTAVHRPSHASVHARSHSRTAAPSAARPQGVAPSLATAEPGPSGRQGSHTAAALASRGREPGINLDSFLQGPFRDSLARSVENARRTSTAFREANLAPPSANSRAVEPSELSTRAAESVLPSEYARSMLTGEEYIPAWLRDADSDQLDLTDLGRPAGRDGRPSPVYNRQAETQDMHDFLRHVSQPPRAFGDWEHNTRTRTREQQDARRPPSELWGSLADEDRETLTARQRRLQRLHSSRWEGSHDATSMARMREARLRNPGMFDFHMHWGGPARTPNLNHFRNVGDYVRDGDLDTSYEGLLNLAELLGEARPRGISEQDLASLPRGTYQEWATPGESSERCPICLDDYEATDPVLRVPACQHWFHQSCIEQWLKTARTCPVCRGRVGDSSRTSTSSSPHRIRPMVFRRASARAGTALPPAGHLAVAEGSRPARNARLEEAVADALDEFDARHGTSRARPRGADRRRE